MITRAQHLGDCFNILPYIPDKSIRLILTDLPYAKTANKQDVKLPMEDYITIVTKRRRIINVNYKEFMLYSHENGIGFKCALKEWKLSHKKGLWSHYSRILADNGTVALYGMGSFASELIESNRKWFKYDVVWNKVLTSGQLNAKHRPLVLHEQLLIFQKKKGIYNAQFTEGKPLHGRGTAYLEKEAKNNNYGKVKNIAETRKGSTQKYPVSIQTFSKVHPAQSTHRTEKSVEMNSWAIKTYTNPGDIVLDHCSGSNTTGEASERCGRSYVTIEKYEEEFTKGKNRIKNTQIELYGKEIGS